MTGLSAPTPPAVVANLRILRRRLGRRRNPWTGADFRHYARITGLCFLFAGILIVTLAAAVDVAAFHWAGDLSDGVRAFFRTATGYGKSEWVLVPSGVLGLLLLFGAWGRVGRRVAAAWTEVGAFCFFLFVAVAGAGLTADLVKWIVGRSRPGRFATDGAFTFTPFASDSIHFSFPSGHATTVTATAVAVVLFAGFRGWVRWPVGLVVAAAATIAVSRVAVRAHFPSDVIGGIAVGATFTVWLAFALGATGVAFQRLKGGGLRARTVAIRSVFRKPNAMGRMGQGLAAALSPRR